MATKLNYLEQITKKSGQLTTLDFDFIFDLLLLRWEDRYPVDHLATPAYTLPRGKVGLSQVPRCMLGL